MSASTPPVTPVVVPIYVPHVASSAVATRAVSLADGFSQLVAFAKANPELMAALVKEFGQPLITAIHSALGSLLGVFVGWESAKLAVVPDPNLTMLLCGGGALVGNAIWNGAVMLIRKWRAPAQSAAPKGVV